VTAGTGGFWLRIAIVCAVFAILRTFDANVVVQGAISSISAATHLHGWTRPGPYLMLAAMFVFGAAVLGLLLFSAQTLHRSVRAAALTMILIILLAVAQSATIYFAFFILQKKVGSVTISRIIEGILLLSLAGCTAWFIRDGRRGIVSNAA
jgi:hypothetical protein